MFTNKVKFKIGEFSKLSQVTIKTLRHYEEVGLLIPFEVDQWSGYRYYDISQLEKIGHIIYLKKVGFSLDEIKEVFDIDGEWPSIDAIEQKLKCNQQEIKRLIWQQLELEKLRISLHKTKAMENITIKSLPSQVFVSYRKTIDSYADLFDLCPNVIAPEMYRLECKCTSPGYCFTVEHDGEYTGHNIDIEYFEAVEEIGPNSDILKFKELPVIEKALCMNHIGPYDEMPKSFAKLYSYLENNGYQQAGLPRFCYIDGIWNKDSEEEWLTEIQIPIEKNA